jgi:dTDP-4-amino-4,6-dideoxygalactose transaminase
LFSAPQPRSRLYTTAAGYGNGLFSALTGIRYQGRGTEKLERALETIHPGMHAVAAPMARVGIYFTLKNLIKPGQKVILSPYTISDVVNMVLCAGGVPLFADTEADGSCNIDANEVRRLLEQESDVGAVMVTHFYGLMCDIDPIVEMCRERGIPLIEDAAQSFGAKHAGKRAGTIGDVGIFSFGLLKNVTSFIGGAVLARDRALADRIRADLKGLPVFPKGALISKMVKGAAFDLATLPPAFELGVYWLFRYAYLNNASFFKNKLDTDSNPVAYSQLPAAYAYQMSGIQADLICAQLDRVDRQTAERVAKAKLYDAGLRDLPLVLPPLRTDGSHNYFYYPIQCEDREGLARYMTEKLRDVQVSHHRNCAAMPCFAEYQRDCPNAELAGRRLLYLPTYPGYREDQVLANIEVIRGFFRTEK